MEPPPMESTASPAMQLLSPPASLSKATATADSNHKPTLLVVDDEDGPRQSLKIVFKNDYNVLLAHDGPSALQLAHEHKINVAVLDIMMAGMSGIEVLHRLKEIDAKIEIIMLTAYETIETARQAVRYDACDYLNKPFDVSTMRAAVSRAALKHKETVALHGTNQKLDSLQEQLRNQKEQEEMVRTKGEIYASVLHDINSPLTVISGFVEIINRSIENTVTLEGDKLDGIRGDLNKLTTQVNRCFEISRRYLSFLHENSCQTSRVSVNQILADLRDLLEQNPNACGQQLTIHFLESDIFAEINGTDLLQILLNLTINALQCCEEMHHVQIRAQRMIYALDLAQFKDTAEDRFINREGFANHAPILAFSVEDDGPGIPGAAMAKLFESQFTTKSPDKGTGLGLSIVKRLVKEAKGAIHLHTKIGEGTTFTVCLQAHE
jgi:two-component system sensor histidine kinase/response regulator